MSNLSPVKRRKAAQRLLNWFHDQGITAWPKTFDVLVRASAGLNEEVFVLWKAFDLLLVLGRVERISPNGKKGARVVDFRPLEEPAKPAPGCLQIGDILRNEEIPSEIKDLIISLVQRLHGIEKEVAGAIELAYRRAKHNG